MSPMTKVQANALFAHAAAGFSNVAELRQRAEILGLEMPEDIRRLILETRRTLLDAGIPLESLNAVPALAMPQ